MNLNLSLAQAQELYFAYLTSWIIPECLKWAVQEQGNLEQTTETKISLPYLRSLLKLGQLLAIDVDGWLAQLSLASPIS